MNSVKNSNALFCEQVDIITNLFQNWNDCEQTVVLYALLRGIPYQNLKFLQMCIESSLQNITHVELKTLEQNANNPSYLRNLLNGSAANDITNQMIDSETLGLKTASYRSYGNLQNPDMNFLIDNTVFSNDKMIINDYFKGNAYFTIIYIILLY